MSTFDMTVMRRRAVPAMLFALVLVLGACAPADEGDGPSPERDDRQPVGRPVRERLRPAP